MRRILSAVVAALLFSGCSSDEMQNRKIEQLNKQAVETVGVPSITNFTEKRQLKLVYELRDQANLPTYTYVRDMAGHLHFLCDSIGFGLPYGTEYSEVGRQEPNGLYPPSAADATWVLCLNPTTKKVQPIYEEDKVTVSLYPLPHANDSQATK